jgi:hypothetical protein
MPTTLHPSPARRALRPIRVVWCVALAALSLRAVTAAATPSGAAPAVHAPTRLVPGISVGNSVCGKVTMSPDTKLSGGTVVSVKVHWTGHSGPGRCSVASANCPTFFGTCSAGYWVVGVFCSTLAAGNLAHAQSYCDLNDVKVLTDYNSGPNNASDRHGTSWNQCSTVDALGSIFGGLPGTLYCLTDGDGGDGWGDHWPLSSTWGTTSGPVPETGSSVPFQPAASGVDCPPSKANIAAGAVPNMCAFVVMPINFEYYCAFDVCAPDVGATNDGVSESTKDYLATLFTYDTTSAQ